MTTQGYFGLDSDDGKSWLLVQRFNDRTTLKRRFEHSLNGFNAMVKYIQHCCQRPRLCIHSSPFALSLIKYLGRISDIEVILVSAAGMRQFHALPLHSAPPAANADTFHPCEFQATKLAQYAQRMI